MLSHIVFEHLCTSSDAAVGRDADEAGVAWRRAGCTEWQGVWGRRPVSLAWDWVELSDGLLRVLKVAPPRSNVRLLDAHGYDLKITEVSSLLWQHIHVLPWQAETARGLLGASRILAIHSSAPSARQ